MATILAISGSPSAISRTQGVLHHVERRLRDDGHTVTSLAVRELPAVPLLAGDKTDPAIRAVVDEIAAADALVVATPIYKAAYTGLLKALLDLLPQYAFAEKSVLPLATGGTTAHVLAIDYALRPVLTSLGTAHVAQGYFVLDRFLTAAGADEIVIDRAAGAALFDIVDRFSSSLRAHRSLAPAG
ncbi:NADPH-dependent FMN reductase [Actinomadura sp. HBU206391]|uniref:NADPH-dependent FMN reductase n=1 Tax=Actinomadura sp. HBU206391 TaxID=2731692 RepID=UPI00164F744C|nr:NADPH-dependent FMN reductase [Actinomadura sp. HBU206391]MBC6457659.1 NADPH-dependent FMN reductase [Actinomadura sp. HBU206391]